MVGAASVLLFYLASHVGFVYSHFTSNLQRQITVLDPNRTLSGDTSSCPGYALSRFQNNEHGLTAHLSLSGKACNAFGLDINDLTIQVTYESQNRLHVNIFDADKTQFTIPTSVIPRPSPPTSSHTRTSDLVFNYDAHPFAFWITRRSAPHDTPLFDTRITSLPKASVPAPNPVQNNSTGLNSFALVFEDQYLQLTSALPKGANVYGLGEVVASSGFRRDVGTDGGVGTVQTLWARDAHDPVDENIYGSHPIYLEHRFDETTQTSASHGVFLLRHVNLRSDILLQTPPSSNVSLIEYRLLGGTLDFYFFSGPHPQAVIEQYGEVVGTPTWIPAWAFGFHLCRWGYPNISTTREQVQRMRAANIPLEVMWNDIDLYHAVRDFTTDPVSFPIDEVKALVDELTANHQHYIPIVDAAVAKQVNATDIYDPYTRGVELDVFIKNPDGSEYIGQVWPGYTVFPDWFANNTQEYWTQAFTNWSQSGVNFSGIWLDMNEASSFCDGSCGTGADLGNTSVPFFLPGTPGNLITDYPEGYDPTVSGPSGNITVNGTLTFGATNSSSSPSKRGLGAAKLKNANINAPPYAIHNGFGPLSIHTLATNATHQPGYIELDVHNMWGLMEEKATYNALAALHPGKRPFLISRSTFPSSGRWTGHWLGDNTSKWAYMYYSIQGVLQFQIFQIPMVGADTGGFEGNTDEELLNRWMQLSAFHPFYRNHNVKGAISQEPYVWDSVANASRTAIAARYALLPYWYTLFANVSTLGTPPVRALFWEFPNEPELFGIDRQFMIGCDILVTPVLTPNVSTVEGIFPGRGKTIWRDWWTHDVVKANSGMNTTLAAPLGHINVHIRDGSALLLHNKPGYTIEETRSGPYALLVSLSSSGSAFGTAYIDDGISFPPGPSTMVMIRAAPGNVVLSGQGSFKIEQELSKITVLGIQQKPSRVELNGKTVQGWQYLSAQDKLVVSSINANLNQHNTLSWT
ncbi:glycosyl hydrolases family 31-domain-containing protein [Hysterangium stoloniferum]|nr:glycosyl hydrolases family 31-domain-containing protein [Hysterangium stoloniferum]